MESLFTVREAAKMLTIRESTLRRWIFDHKIRHLKIGTRSVRISEEEISRIIEQGKTLWEL